MLYKKYFQAVGCVAFINQTLPDILKDFSFGIAYSGFIGDVWDSYLTKRFDINDDGTKKRQEDFASLAGKKEQTADKAYKYSVPPDKLRHIV